MVPWPPFLVFFGALGGTLEEGFGSHGVRPSLFTHLLPRLPIAVSVPVPSGQRPHMTRLLIRESSRFTAVIQNPSTLLEIVSGRSGYLSTGVPPSSMTSLPNSFHLGGSGRLLEALR